MAPLGCGLTLAEWLKDPKFIGKDSLTREGYIKELINITSGNSEVRKNAYGSLFRLTNTERETPAKDKLHVFYNILPIKDPLQVISRIHNIKNKLIEITNFCQNIGCTPRDYLKNLCWEKLASNFEGEKDREKVNLIKEKIASIQEENLRLLSQFSM